MNSEPSEAKFDLKLSRKAAVAVALAIWAAIFLPALGVGELKGEEARRAMPAVNMLEAGRWMVPTVGGEDYYNKPQGLRIPQIPPDRPLIISCSTATSIETTWLAN